MIKNLLTKKIYHSKITRLAYFGYTSLWTSFNYYIQYGTNIFDREWDTLIILDACRVDALRQVADEYSFLKDIESIISTGSSSNEWIANTFTDNYIDEIEKTAYVTANGHIEHVAGEGSYPYVYLDGKTQIPWFGKDKVVDLSDLKLLDQPWKYAPRETKWHIHPKYVTDRALVANQENTPDRLIVHYAQPHLPYISRAVEESRELHSYERHPFDALRNGENFELVWNSYLDNLRLVLDEVAILLDNLGEGSVVISADHGEMFGEFGIYGHMIGLPFRQVREVPWVKTESDNSGNYKPSFSPENTQNQDVEEHLKDLGYI